MRVCLLEDMTNRHSFSPQMGVNVDKNEKVGRG